MKLGAVLLRLVLLAALAATGAWAWPLLPDRHKPWTPLAFDDPPNWLTRYKLDRLDAPTCRALLNQTPLQYTPLPDRDTRDGCVLRDAVRVSRSALPIGSAVTLSCRSAVSLALWERHVVLPAAERVLGRPVQRLEHVGSLACRNVYGRADGRRSQHASGDAIDITGFVLEGGGRAVVARDWRRETAQARFLHEVATGACQFFDGVLGPDYNAAHADHLHLDRGPFRICR